VDKKQEEKEWEFSQGDELSAMRDYIGKLLAHYGGYHNHKETLAHAAMAAMLAFTIGVIAWDEWPPTCWNVKGVALRVGVLGVWAGLYVYMGFELVLRWWSAIMGVALERCASRLVGISSLNEYFKSENKKSDAEVKRWAHNPFWIPWTLECLRVEYRHREYPAVLVHEIEKGLETKDWRLFYLELMFFIVSLTCGVVLFIGAVGLW